MKILFSPSENKFEGGSGKFDINLLSFPQINRQKVFEIYCDFLKNANKDELCKLFGLKNPQIPNINLATKAILRYDGVAFSSLKYALLDKFAQDYIDENCLIFSNLFGILRPNDKIPNYKLSQGEKIGLFDTANFYKNELKDILDEFLKDDDILDLRAGYYDKFYIPSKPYTTIKFLKNGKNLSHFAKYWRGKILQICAKNNVRNINELMRIEIENLSINSIKQSKLQNQIIFDIKA